MNRHAGLRRSGLVESKAGYPFMSDDLRLSRRLLLAGTAGLTGAALGLGGGARAASGPPGPSVPADTGAVQGGRIVFPN